MVPWAISTGRNAVNLMSIKYEDYFHEDLDTFRKRLNFVPYQH